MADSSCYGSLVVAGTIAINCVGVAANLLLIMAIRRGCVTFSLELP